MKKYKYDKKTALTSSTQLELAIMMEALDFSGAKDDDPIIDIDTHKFYEHCYKKFFKGLIERNVKFLKLDQKYLEYSLQMKFISFMNNFNLYDVEKIRVLELAESFIKNYKNYLNK